MCSLVNATQTFRGVEANAARMLLYQRNMTVPELAELAGLNAKVVWNVLCENNPSWPPREAINKALGVEIFAKPTRKPAFRRSLASQVPESKPPTILTELI